MFQWFSVVTDNHPASLWKQKCCVVNLFEINHMIVIQAKEALIQILLVVELIYQVCNYPGKQWVTKDWSNLISREKAGWDWGCDSNMGANGFPVMFGMILNSLRLTLWLSSQEVEKVVKKESFCNREITVVTEGANGSLEKLETVVVVLSDSSKNELMLAARLSSCISLWVSSL